MVGRTVGKRLLALELFELLAIGYFSACNRILTEEVTGPSWAEVPLAVKLTPLGALSLTSRAAVGASADGIGGQLASRTCGSVVEVLVNKLGAAPLAMAPWGSSSRGAKTYVVRGLGDVAERRRRELGDDLLDLDVFSHDCGLVGDAMEERGVF